MAKAGAPEPQAVCDIVLRPAPGVPAVVRLTIDGKASLYLAAEMDCDAENARLWELVGYRPADAGREDAVRRYSVLVERPVPGRTAVGSCDCHGGTLGERRGPCRHLRFLSALWQLGRL